MSASGRLRYSCLVVLASLLPAFAPAETSSSAIDALVKDALKQWRVPGLALAIVRDDRLLFIQGYGVRQVGRADPVTPDTVFPLASCTKPFTSLAIAMLVGEDKMAWDEPVRKHVPFFHLADQWANANVTIRDLLCHRTGIGSHDMLWYKAPWSFEERIRKIGQVELESPFRSLFHYQTILYGTAGYAAGKASGKDWRDLVRSRVLEPLGMASSSPVFPGEKTELAAPHRQDAAGKIGPITRYPLDQPDPAGFAAFDGARSEPVLAI